MSWDTVYYSHGEKPPITLSLLELPPDGVEGSLEASVDEDELELELELNTLEEEPDEEVDEPELGSPASVTISVVVLDDVVSVLLLVLFEGTEITLPVSKSTTTVSSPISPTATPSAPSEVLTPDLLDSLSFFPQPQNKRQPMQRIDTNVITFFIIYFMQARYYLPFRLRRHQ